LLLPLEPRSHAAPALRRCRLPRHRSAAFALGTLAGALAGRALLAPAGPRPARARHDAACGSVTPATLAGAAKRVCGIELAPSVVAVLFSVFDSDGDGKLSPPEFLDVMARRSKLEGASGDARRSGAGAGGGPSLYDCCAECVAKWRDAASA